MTTLSIPLSPELEAFVEKTAKESGLAKTDVVRQALRRYEEELAIERVILASQGPVLYGDLEKLAESL